MNRYGATDVHYPDTGGARAALVVSAESTFITLTEEHTAWLETVAPYHPGRFFERELPAIRAVLARTAPVDLLLIDGYVTLDPDGRPGLGAHLQPHLRLPIIGVAKTAFHTATHAIEVRRGRARKPLYVTATGIEPADAARLVSQMAGDFRIPTALHRVDRLARAG